MKSKTKICFIATLAAATIISSCNRKPDGNNWNHINDPGSATTTSGKANYNASPSNAETAARPPIKRAPKKLLAALPCSFENKEGVFAAFPDNKVAGQQCFNLYAALNQAQNGAVQFDIQGGGLAFVFHGPAHVTADAVQLMKWKLRNGSPCYDQGCGVALAAKVESIPDDKNPGWTYTVVSPQDPINLAAQTDGFYGVVNTSGGATVRYLPVFN